MKRQLFYRAVCIANCKPAPTASLRISQAPQELWQQFGAFGVPNTFVIDKTGSVRTQHLGGIPDVSRYITADLNVIADGTP